MRFFLLLSLLFLGCSGKTPPQAPVENLPVVPEVEAQTSPEPVLLHSRGLGPWRLGMSRFDVLQAFEPGDRIEPVRVTGGFECPDWKSPLGTRRVSFVFDENYRLEKIQLWLFDGSTQEGLSEKAHRLSWANETWTALGVIGKLVTLSSASSESYLKMEQEDFAQALVAGSAEGMPFSLNFKIENDPAASTRQWISVIASPQGAYSFLFAAR